MQGKSHRVQPFAPDCDTRAVRKIHETMKMRKSKPGVNAFSDGAVICFQLCDLLLLLLFQFGHLTLALFHDLVLFRLALFVQLDHRSFSLRYSCLQHLSLRTLAFELRLSTSNEYGDCRDARAQTAQTHFEVVDRGFRASLCCFCRCQLRSQIGGLLG